MAYEASLYRRYSLCSLHQLKLGHGTIRGEASCILGMLRGSRVSLQYVHCTTWALFSAYSAHIPSITCREPWEESWTLGAPGRC